MGNKIHAKKRKVVVVVFSNFLVFNYALQMWPAALNPYRLVKLFKEKVTAIKLFKDRALDYHQAIEGAGPTEA